MHTPIVWDRKLLPCYISSPRPLKCHLKLHERFILRVTVRTSCVCIHLFCHVSIRHQNSPRNMIDFMVAMGEYVSMKSTPKMCLYHLATCRALYHITCPRSLRFLSNTHMHSIGLISFIFRTSLHESFSELSSSSSLIAFAYPLASLLFMDCWYAVGASFAVPTFAASASIASASRLSSSMRGRYNNAG